MHKVVNYGSALQAWATQEVIRAQRKFLVGKF